MEVSIRTHPPWDDEEDGKMGVRLVGLLPADLDEEQAEVYRAITGGARASGPRAFR